MVGELLNALGAFQTRLRGRTTVNVNDRETKEAALALASSYFNTHRPRLAVVVGDLTLRGHDEGWQELVRLAHGNNQRKSYQRTVKSLLAELKDASVHALARAAERSEAGRGPSDLTPAELRLLDTLQALLPTAAASYRQAILDLGSQERLSYRGTASELREALRETLDHLAPDSEVAKQQGFKPDTDQTRPSMKQKVRFVLLSRGRSKTQAAVTERSVSLAENLVGEVVRATYDRASLATHLETTRAEVVRIKRYVDTLLFDLLEIPDTLPAAAAPR
jgi:hypothetical protein